MFKSGEKLHWIRNLYRRYKYGGGCCDVFGLDFYLAKKILPALKEFRRSLSINGGGYPIEFKSMEEWLETLDKIIWSFEYLVNGEEWEDIIECKEKGEKEQEGFELFGKHFRNLWI